MSLITFISNYSAYNAWANHRLIHWLKTVEPGVLYKQVPSSFTSIDNTLQHILRTQRYWLLFISEVDTSGLNWVVRENEVDNILSELGSVSDEMKKRFSSFSEADLQKVLHLRSPWAENDLPRYEYIVHVINHGTYHRGQIITMARSTGISDGFVNTDYNFFNIPQVIQ